MSKVVVGLLGMAVGLTLSVSVQALAASPHGGPAGARSFVLVTRQPEVRILDLGPRGLSEGDVRVFNLVVYDANGVHTIGRLDGSCTVTDPPNGTSEKRITVECVKTFTLPGGTISVEGVATFSALSNYPFPAVQAITGGTGTYQGARGQVSVVARGPDLIQTMQIMP